LIRKIDSSAAKAALTLSIYGTAEAVHLQKKASTRKCRRFYRMV